jgi:SAM-dependent methyltransferase
MSTAALFEHLAIRYDELWTDSAIGRAQRNAVWRVVDPLFHAGDRVLDIGCGTGEDAAHLASRGVSVHAIDASPAMVARASARAVGATRGSPADQGVRPTFTAQLLRAENVADLRETFDGAISNFGALNCVEDLAAFARALAPRIRPGGRVAICVIGRFCAWEMLYPRKALRRLPGRAGDVYYPSVRKLRADFAPHFELRSWTGIGMLVPPSYVKLPARIVRLLARLDRMPFLRSIADHRLLVFERK